MTILVFDIETIPDIESGRRLFALDGLSDEDTACAMFALRREKAGNDFCLITYKKSALYQW